MKRWLAVFCLPALLAAGGPAPLVTGAVRDQFGDPISGASIIAADGRTRTDAAGTFALETHAKEIRISCDYCNTTVASVASDDTVVAIVERYHEIATETLTPGDLRALPYARIESALSLQPFVVLNDSSALLPGPRISYYGLSQTGGLLVDNGIAAYDIAAGATPFRTIPAYDTASAVTRDPSDAFRYGDLANGGSFFVQTQPGDGNTLGAAIAGSQHASNIVHSAERLAFDAASSADQDSARARADASVQIPIGDDSLNATALAARDDTQVSPSTIDSSLTAARVHYDRTRSLHTFADVAVDRGQYTYTSAIRPIEGEWTDLSLQTGVSSNAKISMFADAGARFSAGYYDAESISLPKIAGNIVQTHLSMGASSQLGGLSWKAGIGAFNVSYRGGSAGASSPNSAQIITPSLSLLYNLGPQWQFAVDAHQSFRLPTLLEEYGYGADTSAIYFDRYGTQDVKLTYTDLHRVRLSLFAMNANVSRLDNGPISAAGASVAWQVAPDISLRAWTLHFDDASQPYQPIFRFGAPPQPATPASAWATFENPHGLRADLVWREDLLDYRTESHLDASLGAPVTGELRWFIGTERRAGTRYVSAGLRLWK